MLLTELIGFVILILDTKIKTKEETMELTVPRTLLEHHLKRKDYDKAVEVAKLLPESQKVKELTRILHRCVGEKGVVFVSVAIKIADLLSGAKKVLGLTKILQRCKKEGWYKKVRDVANLLPEPQRTKELIAVIQKYTGYSSLAIDTANLLSEPQKTKQLIKIIQTCIGLKWKVEYATGAAQALLEPRRTEELKKILKKYVREGWLDEARKVAEFLPEAEKEKWLKML